MPQHKQESVCPSPRIHTAAIRELNIIFFGHGLKVRTRAVLHTPHEKPLARPQLAIGFVTLPNPISRMFVFFSQQIVNTSDSVETNDGVNSDADLRRWPSTCTIIYVPNVCTCTYIELICSPCTWIEIFFHILCYHNRNQIVLNRESVVRNCSVVCSSSVRVHLRKF